MKLRPVFLELDHVLRIHEDMLRRYGGSAGVRDAARLESAVAMPRAGIGGEFLHEDIPTMAAAHLFHIVKNRPFIDGNERAGAFAAFAFLSMNGYRVTASEKAFGDLVLVIAAGRSDKAAAAAFFHRWTRKERSRKRK
jgi:death-on-curing protein